MTNIKDYKEKRKVKIIIDDLENVERLMSLIVKGMIGYKKYTPVKDLLSNVLDNKAIVSMYLKQYKKSLENMDENKLG